MYSIHPLIPCFCNDRSICIFLQVFPGKGRRGAHVHGHVHTYTSTGTRVHRDTDTYARVRSWTHTETGTNTDTCTCMDVHTHMCTHGRTGTHILVHTLNFGGMCRLTLVTSPPSPPMKVSPGHRVNNSPGLRGPFPWG